jgi:hypothetical protein
MKAAQLKPEISAAGTRQTFMPALRDQDGLADRNPIGANLHVKYHAFLECPIDRRQEDAREIAGPWGVERIAAERIAGDVG